MASSREIKGSAASGWAIGEATVAEIDRLNIYWASVLAMERAIAAGCGSTTCLPMPSGSARLPDRKSR